MTTPVLLQERASKPVYEARLRSAGFSPLLSKLLASRGASSPMDAGAGYDALLPGSAMKNVVEMANYLADCVVTKKRVLIISDYDCDGATACAVLVMAFGASGMNFDFLVPDRQKHGYGLTPAIVEEAAALDIRPDVIITVDNGISSIAGVDRAAELGIEVLVTDHHLAPAVLPAARLIVNPNQAGCTFPSKDIAGCGVAWYVARALVEELATRDMDPGFDPAELLSYVALGTVADVVKLDKNNRILIREGLGLIRNGICAPGVLALARVAGKNYKTLSCSDIGFGIGPRINAAGRLDHMKAGVECLTTLDVLQAQELAKRLDKTNEERKDIQMEIVDQAVLQASEAMGDGDDERYSIVAYHPEWHEGVVGIVAGRIKEDRHRPTIVMCEASDGDIKGSGRSIPGFHLKHALDKINIRLPGILKKFGGHAMAAGMTIDRDRLEEFKDALETVCKEDLTPDLLVKKIMHDGEISAETFTIEEIKALNLEVWGQGFEEPVFLNEIKVGEVAQIGELKNHLRIHGTIHDQEAVVLGFGFGHLADAIPETITVAFKPQINNFRETESLQVLIEQFPSGLNPVLADLLDAGAPVPDPAAAPKKASARQGKLALKAEEVVPAAATAPSKALPIRLSMVDSSPISTLVGVSKAIEIEKGMESIITPALSNVEAGDMALADVEPVAQAIDAVAAAAVVAIQEPAATPRYVNKYRAVRPSPRP